MTDIINDTQELLGRKYPAHLLKCLEEEYMKPFPCKTAKERAKLYYFASAKHRRKGGWYLVVHIFLIHICVHICVGIQWGIQYSLVNLVQYLLVNIVWDTASPGSYGGTVFPGGYIRYSLVNNVCGIRYSLGYRIHSDTGIQRRFADQMMTNPCNYRMVGSLTVDCLVSHMPISYSVLLQTNAEHLSVSVSFQFNVQNSSCSFSLSRLQTQVFSF